jgi:hypothetical protein
VSSTIYQANEGPNDATPAQANTPKTVSDEDKKLLDKLLKRFRYHTQAWSHIRDEAEEDMRALSVNGLWEPEEIDDRDKAGRPHLHLDQLGQYCNNLINEVRQNPIGINIAPAGDGSNDQTALLRADRIRQIEYETNAPVAYRTAFECCVQRGYGVFGLTTDYESWDSDNLVFKFRRFPNPDAISWDPDCKEQDCSDMADAFVLDRVTWDKFKEDHPDATIVDFKGENSELVTAWVDRNEETIQIAEYWYREFKKRHMYTLADGTRVFKDELAQKGFSVANDGKTMQTPAGTIAIAKERDVKQPFVKQVLTNGLEILERSEFPGIFIPIFPILGKEKFRREKGKVIRDLESYIRMGRHGQMLFDYYKTNEAEDVGYTPKPKWVGYEGQFNTATPWKDLNKSDVTYVEVKGKTPLTGEDLLPLPTWETYQPNTQALEVGAESARRAIQAALGSYGVTRLDDTNVKSGKAINLLDKQADLGSFHFIDNYKIAIQHAGRVLNGILDIVEDTQRQVGVRSADGQHNVVTINKPFEQGGKARILSYNAPGAASSKHDVTVGTAPSFQSQREAADDFLDSLASSNPAVFEKVGDLVVKLKNLGPIGDQIAERLTPAEYREQPTDQQQLAQLQGQIQQLEAALNDAMKQLDAYKADLPKIEADKQIAAEGNASKERIAAMQAEVDKLKIQLEDRTKRDVAALQANVDQIKNVLDIQAAREAHVAKYSQDSDAGGEGRSEE